MMGSGYIYGVAMKFQWVFPEKTNPEAVRNLKDQFNLHTLIAQILIQRQIEQADQIRRFFNPSLDDLYDPFLIPDMDKAVERILKALRDGENILIYGDYDVDGVTSVSILYDGLFRMGGKVSFFIPSRFKEGYGVSNAGVRIARNRDVSLLITVDCGITAVQEVEYAREFGIDVIICDHHEPGEEVPKAVAVVNPKLMKSEYPFRELAGCGVAFKVLQAVTRKIGLEKTYAYKYLDLVALGTAADIVQLTDENRILVKYGLEKLQSKERPGVYALAQSSGLIDREITVSVIVFVIAPRLNAVGRISNAKKAVHLLTTDSMQQARNIARILEKENKKRKDIDEITFQSVKDIIDREIDLDSTRVIVLAHKDWHPGVIGIVASRIMEKYSRPTLLISIQDGIGKGSARSTQNFDIYRAFSKLKHLFIAFGGHRFAAGVTIKEENIPLLAREINEISEAFLEVEDMVPKLQIDAEVEFDQFNPQFFNGLKRLAPYGPSNMRPVFISRNLQLFGNAMVIGNNHLKVKFKQKAVVLDAIGYHLGEYVDVLNRPHSYINCAYVIDENTWNGQTTIQMKIKDFEVYPHGRT